MLGKAHQCALTGIVPLVFGENRSVLGKPLDHVVTHDSLIEVAEVGLTQRSILASQLCEMSESGLEIFLMLGEIPVNPRQIAVLAVGVVVSELSLADFISGGHHRHTRGEKQSGQKVSSSPAPLSIDRLV